MCDVVLLVLCFCQGGVSDDMSLTGYIAAAMLELDGDASVSLTPLYFFFNYHFKC